MSGSRLVEHLISVGNKSGAVPAAAVNLLDVKGAIKNLPISVDVPSISVAIDVDNLVRGIVDTVDVLGSLSAVGDFRNILGRIASELSVTDITKVDPDQLAAAIKRSVPLEELTAAVGQATALAASLSGSVKRIAG